MGAGRAPASWRADGSGARRPTPGRSGVDDARSRVAAHQRAMRFAQPGRMEYEVMAELLHEFGRSRADISYHPIVGGGPNSCILHYHENSAELIHGDPARTLDELLRVA